MSEIEIYDSQGYRLESSDDERHETIQEMGRHGVLLSLVFANPVRLITYFRGYESESGRMEQYYAEVVVDTPSDLANIHKAITHTAEDRYGLKIEETESGKNIFSNLRNLSAGSVGTELQRNRIAHLLTQGQRLHFGVHTYEDAIRLIAEMTNTRPGLRTAIIEDGTNITGPFTQYDLVLEKGSYAGLEPLGETRSMMNPDSDSETEAKSLADDVPLLEAKHLNKAQTLGERLLVGILVGVVVVVLYIIISLIAGQFGIHLPYTPDIPSLKGLSFPSVVSSSGALAASRRYSSRAVSISSEE